MKVLSVEILADPLTSTEHVKSRMETKAGEVLSETLLDEDIRRLYASGYICTRIDRIEDGGGIRLKVHISSHAAIKEIHFNGNYRMSSRLLKEKIELYEGGLAQPHRIRREEIRIEDLYRQKGYYFVCVGSNLNIVADGGLLTFRVWEGPRVVVNRIQFEGNSSFQDGILARVIRTRRHWLLNPSPFIYEKIHTDIELLKRHYRTKGWLDAQISVKTDFNAAGSRAQVTFVISEGEGYAAGTIRVTGNTVYSTEEITKKMTLSEGDPLDLMTLARDARKIRDMYTSQGYMLTRVSTKERPREGESALDIDYVIKESIKTTIEKIDIVGNERTKDEVLRRELRFFPGDVFNSRKIEDSKNALGRLGYFSAVDIAYGEGSSEELAQIAVSVKEKDTGQFMFGASYGSDAQFGGFIRLTETNFDFRRWPGSWRSFAEKKAFKGGGQRLRLNFQGSSERIEYNVDFTEPWIFNRPLSMSLGASQAQHMYSQYDLDKTSWYVALGRKLGYDARIELSYRQEAVDLHDVDVDVLPAIGDEFGKNDLSRLRLSVSIDKRNRRFFPTRGFTLSVGHELVGDSLGGDLDFQKTSARCSWIRKLFEWPLGTPHVLKLVADVRWAKELDDTSNVPIYERYWAGGIRTVRGYERRSLGPTSGNEEIGGNFRLVTNVEYSFPLYEEVIHGVLFWDNGEVWADEDDFGWNDLKRSVGVGIRFQTPIFPVEFYYGWASDELPGEPSGRFHFALGYSF
ncbi:outer membrane protein assembly factor BamA [Planctomycetota bacterium]